VPDVAALAEELKAMGLRMKPRSRSRQPARAPDGADRRPGRATVRAGGWQLVTRRCPDLLRVHHPHDDPDSGKIDLTFDSGNATGIFAVTAAA
jgi:hypothetical protein